MGKLKIFDFLSSIYTEQRFQDPKKTPKIKKYMDFFILILAMISIALYVVEELEEYKIHVIHTISISLDYVFLMDYSLRFFFSGITPNLARLKWSLKLSRRNYAFRWYGIIDLLSVLPPLLYHVLHVGSIVEEYSRVARVLRLLRVARILRILRSLRFFRYSENISRNIKSVYLKINREIKFLAIAIGIVLVISSMGLLHYAKTEGSDNSIFTDLGDSLYWSIIGVLGQADGTAIHAGTEAKILTIFLMFVGVAFFGIITGSISSYFMERMKMDSKGKHKFSGMNHILMCGFNSKIPELLLFLQNNHITSEIVLLFDRGQDEEHFAERGKYRNENLAEYIHVVWIKGTPTNEIDLERAGAGVAKKIIILSDISTGSTNENDIDARSLMTLIKIEEIYKEHNLDRSKVEISIELESKTSVKFAKLHGANRIIYSDELISNYITAEFGNALPIYDTLMGTKDQIISLVDIHKMNHAESQNIEKIEEIIRGEYNSTLLGFQFNGSFLKTLASDDKKCEKIKLFLNRSGITFQLSNCMKSDDNNLIVLNPWSKIREEFCKFLIGEYNNAKQKNDSINCIIMGNIS
jgi:voltage-gated potassium channel